MGFSIGPNGVAFGWGKVFAATSDGVAALDADTGRLLWNRRLTALSSGGVDIQPTVVDGLVLMATVPVSVGGIYKGGDRGWLYALYAATGKTAWSFDTVDSTTIWGNPTINSGGGAWYPPSIDQPADRVYWGTANPAPFPGTTRVSEWDEPTGIQSLHRLDRGTQSSYREAGVVSPSYLT